MKRFDLVLRKVEISYKDKDRIKEGCTIYGEPERIARFDTMEEALQALSKHQTSISLLKKAILYYLIEEYMVEVNEYDEAGEWIAGGDVLAISPMNDVF